MAAALDAEHIGWTLNTAGEDRTGLPGPIAG